MEYKRLSDYIREVNIRNRELKVTKLVGLTIDKAFIPSVANVIGTDLSSYKVIRREQFACSLMQVSRDGKMPVAMFEEDEAIMSPAYPMFEIIDKTELLPQYLMMWFSRSEFDREASYYAVGGVRGSLTWEDFCNMTLPIPSITRQCEIVSEYETLTKRIHLNEQMIQHLEATSQALYRKMFVDNTNVKRGTVKDLCNCFSGYPFDGECYSEDSGVVALRGENVTEQSLRWDTTKRYNDEITPRISKCYLKAWDIVIGMDGSKVGKNWSLVDEYDLPLLLAQRVACLRTDRIEKQVYLYLTLCMEQFSEYVSRVNTGSTILHISASQIDDFPIPIPTNDQFDEMKFNLIPLFKRMCLNRRDIYKLKELQSLLLAKMGNWKQ